MAISIDMKDSSTVVINDVVQVRDNSGRLEVKFLTTPGSKWIDGQDSTKIPAGASVAFGRTAVPNRSFGNMSAHPATQVYAPDADAIDRDPHFYQNGNNGLTIAESARRVVERVYWQTWGEFHAVTCGSTDDLNKVARAIIRNNKGRDYAYTLAGRVKNLYNEKTLRQYSLVRLFEFYALLDGAIKEPVLAG